MTVKGDLVNDREFFKQQWTDYEVATGLDKQEQKIRLATFRSTMGKECLQIFLNLKLTTEEQQDIDGTGSVFQAEKERRIRAISF